MTNGVNGSKVNVSIANNTIKNQERARAQSGDMQKKNELTKTEALKEKIASGEYKIDINAVAKKMAEELLS